ASRGVRLAPLARPAILPVSRRTRGDNPWIREFSACYFPPGAFGRSAGTGACASPEGAHSTHRTISTWEAGLPRIAATSWPSTFSTTRPLPEVDTHTTGSWRSVFLGSFFLSEKAVTSTSQSGNITEFWYTSSLECISSVGRPRVIGWSFLRTVR